MPSINNLDNINISSDLYGHDYVLINFIKLYESGNFPKVSLVTGEKGIGKFTLVFHLIIYIFSKIYKQPYNLEEHPILSHPKRPDWDASLDKTIHESNEQKYFDNWCNNIRNFFRFKYKYFRNRKCCAWDEKFRTFCKLC